MEVGARVWVQDAGDAEVWAPAELLHVHHKAPGDEDNTSIHRVTVLLTTAGRELEVPLVLAPGTGEIRNVLLQNQPGEQDQSDLVTLPHLHEASILHALRLRYARDAIYTRIGEILISINPFKRLPGLYTREAIDRYGAPSSSNLETDPHLYGIARAAYVDVLRNGRNQSILISGESGAGKTEATKIMMKYFAVTCGTTPASAASSSSSSSPPSHSPPTSIESQVLQSNPILEAFGNARTVRNDNSSRFGKFIELQLDAQRRHAIVGARIRTYLLEKIRVTHQAPEERNFHIFYELLAASAAACGSDSGSGSGTSGTSASPATTLPTTESSRQAAPALWATLAPVARTWGLTAPVDFRIVNQSGCFCRRDGIRDLAQFERTYGAMQHIGLAEHEIHGVLGLVAAVLHMGNIAFAAQHTAAENVQEAVVPEASGAFAATTTLLGVAPEHFTFALTKRRLQTATERLTVSLDVAQAEHTRNALVMECYRLLFAWLVRRINAKIDHHHAATTTGDGDPGRTRGHDRGGHHHCIGLLDIFGFEDMATNSFEQLCINYANEALQHQFNEFVFDAEQRLYRDEGIAWAFVDFPNNAACLELFERRPVGLFSLADQECLFPQGTDRALLAKLYGEFERKSPPHPHFQAPPSGWQRQSHFVIVHYAGRVAYAVEGFLAKNRDAFCETAALLLAQSTSPVVQSVADAAATPTPTPTTAATTATATSTTTMTNSSDTTRKGPKSTLAAASVGTQFKLQLNELLDLIRATAPHYVRCIKPNDTNVSDAFGSARVVEQLRSGGVLEAVRVARAGFPVRMAHAQFLERYQCVLGGKRGATGLERYLQRLRAVVPTATTGVSLGRTRVFFRRQPYEQLEQFRVVRLREAAIAIQRVARGYRARHAFVRLRGAVRRLQARARGARARCFVTWLRATRRATTLQTCVRGFLARMHYGRFRGALVRLQGHHRRREAARRVHALRQQRAATRLGAFWRGARARRAYRRLRSAALGLQCGFRRRVAARALRALRLESRNISKLQQDNVQLQTELSRLRQQLVSMQAQFGRGGGASTMAPCAQERPSNQSLEAAASTTVTTTTTSSVTPPPPPALALRMDWGSSDLSSGDEGPARVHALSAHSVLPPTHSGSRRGSLPHRSSSSSSSMPHEATTMSKAELLRDGSRRFSSAAAWRTQQARLEAEAETLRVELRAAMQASNPAEEQEHVVKRFLDSALRTTSSFRLPHRLSGSFELALPQDCDNNSNVDNEDDGDDDDDGAADNEAEDGADETEDGGESSPAVSTPRRPQHKLRLPPPEPSAAVFATKRDRPTPLAAPLTAIGRPHHAGSASRFTWGSDERLSGQSTASSLYSHGPQSVRLRGPQHTPRFFGDSVDGLSTRSESWRLGLGGTGGGGCGFFTPTHRTSSIGSVPRWCKDAVCKACQCKFTFLTRRHHCRSCGNSFCYEHSSRRMRLPALGYTDLQRVCDDCFEWRMQRLTSHESGDEPLAVDEGVDDDDDRRARALSPREALRRAALLGRGGRDDSDDGGGGRLAEVEPLELRLPVALTAPVCSP